MAVPCRSQGREWVRPDSDGRLIGQIARPPIPYGFPPCFANEDLMTEELMPAYAIFTQPPVTNMEKMQAYRAKAMAAIQKHGGKVLAADANFDVPEGSTNAEQAIIIEFPNKDALNTWYHSNDYKPLVQDRIDATGPDGTFLFVDGLPT